MPCLAAASGDLRRTGREATEESDVTIRLDAEAFGANEDGSFEGTQVAFYPDRSTDDPLPLLASVLEAAGEALAGDAGFWGPVPLPRSATLFAVQWWNRPGDLTDLLSLVGDGMAAAGTGGELRPFASASPAYERTPRETFDGVAVVLDPHLRVDAVDRAGRRGGFHVSDVDPDSLDACIERMLRWCRVPSGVHYAQFAAASFEVAEEEREGILRRSFATDDVATLTSERWPVERRSATFDGQGRLLLVRGQRDVATGAAPLLAAVEELRASAGVADYGCAFRVSSPVTDFTSALRSNRPQLPPGIGMQWTRALEATRIPDVLPAQLLGQAHELPPALATGWSVESLGSGARLLLPEGIEPWTRRGGPEVDVLSSARSDFLPLLMTAADVTGERRRISARARGAE
jgi:hypothetical protein